MHIYRNRLNGKITTPCFKTARFEFLLDRGISNLVKEIWLKGVQESPTDDVINIFPVRAGTRIRLT